MANKAMSKTQIVNYLADTAQISKKAAAGILEEFVALAIKETKKAGQFVIPGIGKLVKRHQDAREYRNPQTGEAIKKPARSVVKFRVAKACKDAVVPPKGK